MPNYYDTLGISKEASEKDIRQAFRRLARQHHPDVNPDNPSAEDKFKEINEAYTVLNDPESRKKYDRYGDNWKYADQHEQAGPGSRRSYRRSSRDGGDPFGGSGAHSSIFDLFGGAGAGFRSGGGTGFRPPPVEHHVDISLEEAFQGASRVLQLQDGRRIEAKIPAGVDNGSKVHISPDGNQGGDFNLVVSVVSHPKFQRQGRDLYVDVDLALDDAILGTETAVPTLTGQLALTVPPETPNGRRFRLSGQGMPSLGAGPAASRGDLYATVRVVLPTGLTEEEREFFRQLRERRASQPDD